MSDSMETNQGWIAIIAVCQESPSSFPLLLSRIETLSGIPAGGPCIRWFIHILPTWLLACTLVHFQISGPPSLTR